MKKIAFLFATALIVSLSSCEKIDIPDINNNPNGGGGTSQTTGTVIGQGPLVTKIFNETGFDKIDLKLVADVVYIQDATFKVEVTAQQNIINILNIKTDNSNTLILKSDSSYSTNKGIHIEIHSPSIYGLAVNGTGKISSTNAINTTLLKLNLNGTGDIELDKLTTTDLIANLTGTGSILIKEESSKTETINLDGSGSIQYDKLSTTDLKAKLKGTGSILIKDGTAKTEDLETNGSGEIISDGLQADKSKALATGTSTINLNATTDLDVTILGISTVNYKGNPTITKSISNLGKLNKI